MQPAKRQPQRADSRIGFGFTNLIAETLFDTGKFRLWEDKRIHQRAVLDKLIRTYWVVSRPAYAVSELQRAAAQLDVELLAYGRVLREHVSQRTIRVGLITHLIWKLHVVVRVCLYDAGTATRLCREGQGKAEQKGGSVIFEVLDNARLVFVKNAAGLAARDAVQQAIARLSGSIVFGP